MHYAREIAVVSIQNVKDNNEKFKLIYKRSEIVKEHYEDFDDKLSELEKEFTHFDEYLQAYFKEKDPFKIEEVQQKCRDMIKYVCKSYAYKYSSCISSLHDLKDSRIEEEVKQS